MSPVSCLGTCSGPFWAVPSWVCSDPFLSPISVPPREGGFGSSVQWLSLCTRQGSVSLCGAFQAWTSQRQKANFKNPRNPNTQRVGTETPSVSLTHCGSVLPVLYQGAPQGIRPQFRSATAPLILLNQETEGVLLLLLIQVPLTGFRFFSYRNWIFPKVQIFRPWLLVPPSSSTAKGYQKIKHGHLPPVDMYQRADFQHKYPVWYRSAFLTTLSVVPGAHARVCIDSFPCQ